MNNGSEKAKVHRNRRRVYESLSEESSRSEVPQTFSAAAAVSTVTMTAEPETPESGASIPTILHDEKIPCGQSSNNPHHAAMQIVHRWSGWAAGIGLVPLPVVDMVAMMAVQIAMLRKLAAVYGVPFHEQRSKSAVAALIGSINAGYLGGSLLKMVPVFGLVSLAAMPVVTGAITYAVGRVFIRHFASGGTFLDFDSGKARSCFDAHYQERKQKPR